MSWHIVLLGDGFVTHLLHALFELRWHFFKDLFCQVSSTYCIIEAYKLNYIASSNFSMITKALTITVELLH